MFKNRAAWLAVAVLAIASAIMIFVIMPQINGTVGDAGKQPQEAAKKAGDAVGEDVVTAAGKVGRENATGSVLLEKVDRLKADAAAAAKSLQALYAGGRTPTDAELADARAKLEAALRSIAEIKAPSGADTAVSSVVSGLSASAAKALEALKSMPADAGKAAETVSLIAGLFGNGAADKAAAPAQAPEAPSSTTPAPAVATDDKMPAFDVLRVEKDGSTVIAGRAAPGSSVEIVDGDKTIASSKAGPEGDFAIVLDTPLSAGDHTLVLKSTDTTGKVVQSQEEATVSVPASSSGELLAMVSKPGEASRILSMPEADGKQAAAASAAPAHAQKADAVVNGLPPLPSASNELTSSAPSLDVAPVAEEPAAPKPAEAAEIRIEAVEIEGDNMYVAGISRPETSIQVYVDDKLLQATKSSADGHFVAEGVMPLAVGNHIVRADVMDSAGSKVLLRASVPFNRPPGDQVSVVADTTAKGSATAPGLVGGGPLEQLREEAAKAIVLLKGLFEDGKTPAKDQLAAAKSACQIAFKALAGFKPAPDASPEVVAAAGVAAKSAADALKILDAAGDDPAKVGAAVAAIEAAAKGAMPEVVKPSDQKSPAVKGGSSAEMSSAAPAGTQAPAVASSEPKSVEQAPLKESSNSVIIRKGDTLWQISRRLYGRGIRYTTIYLANQDQINDPNMITPGQVFGVPDKTLQSDEDAEKANRNFQDR